MFYDDIRYYKNGLGKSKKARYLLSVSVNLHFKPPRWRS